MSVEAITWALGQPIKHSTAKFVLVCLANCADSEGRAWPSIAYLCEATAQDRKTVIENLRRLKEAGLLQSTGEMKGRTGQVPVYRLSVNTVPKTAPVPKKAPVPKTELVPETERAPVPKTEPVPVPKTGHGNVIEPSVEPSVLLSGKKPDVMPAVREVLQFLRNMTGRQYREVDTTVNLIKARLKNTSVADIKRTLAYKGDQWLNDPKMEPYLRPLTLFAASNFEQYLAEALANEPN